MGIKIIVTSNSTLQDGLGVELIASLDELMQSRSPDITDIYFIHIAASLLTQSNCLFYTLI